MNCRSVKDRKRTWTWLRKTSQCFFFCHFLLLFIHQLIHRMDVRSHGVRAEKRFIIVIFSQNSNEWICLSIHKSIHIILIDMLHTYLITWFLPSLSLFIPKEDMFTSISFFSFSHHQLPRSILDVSVSYEWRNEGASKKNIVWWETKLFAVL